ncbi:unnamed protein product, partial [Phaeothamnion confervicola]
MDSHVLHALPQRFPTEMYRIELEREIDTMLREQVYEGERVARFTEDLRKRRIGGDRSVSDSSDDADENWE